MYTPPDKTNLHFIRACGRELYEVFDSVKNPPLTQRGGFLDAQNISAMSQMMSVHLSTPIRPLLRQR